MTIENRGNLVGVLRTRTVSEADELDRWRTSWDELAVAASQPYEAPGWLIPWWRHVAPRSARLRTTLAFDGPELVAVAPMFAERGPLGSIRYRLLGARTSSRVDVVSRPDVEIETVASAIARSLAATSPAPDLISFDGVPRESPWPRLLALAWPSVRQPATHRAFSLPVPKLSLKCDDFDNWYASKSRNFRQTFRRRRRQLEKLGANVSLLRDPSMLTTEIEAFSRLHRSRWHERGGSRVLTPNVERMLEDAGRSLISEDRFRLFSIRVNGSPISSHIFLSAGARTTYWLGGFDDAWAKYHPAMLTILAALEHDFAECGATFDLGTGDQPYKSRLADSSDYVDWVSIATSRRFTRVAQLEYAEQRIRIAAARRLPRRAKDAVQLAMRARARLS